MQIITTHTGTDFDALASVVAGTFLYPGSVGVLPGMVNPEVKQFLAIHANILRITPRKDFDIDAVTSIVVVDANNWKRLDKMDSLAEKEGLEVICWDHHMEGVTIDSCETHREEVGAAVTLLLEEMQRRDTPLSPMHATLFLLGIYSDTGCLRYPSVTSRDAAMVSFLIENGADLNVVSAYLDDSMDDAHTELFGKILEEAEIVNVGSINVGICALQINSGLTSLSTLVEKFREFRGVDAAFGIFQADSRKCMVIGRGKPQFIDIGQLMRALGGGGHPGAGSAIIKNTSLEEAADQVRSLTASGCNNKTEVGAVMSDPGRFIVAPDVTMAQAAQKMSANNISGLIICNEATPLGGLSELDCTKAVKSGRADVPVKGYARRNIPIAAPSTCCREATMLMANAREGVLAVVDNNELVGVVTQTDLLLQVYDF
ncbi:CBS domain-containing protein [Pseudodesulfovibrio sp. zrk46]|uniref:CBS domain-containing protein n=1 Tax=Pseudodesulfovibrio sp. zrk46 TaxID=2725288 RepID=UPI00144A0346|nr:CBS domain-containing protein [Pseudodesulfovibrio sp. zrk46]QJB56653.1 CBS domain-containing protein [Pseudodesulfovibrio sp. zrk46]